MKHEIIMLVLFLLIGLAVRVDSIYYYSPVRFNFVEVNVNDHNWYTVTSDWINVTLTSDFRVAIPRKTLVIQGYWKDTCLNCGEYSWIRVESWGYNNGACHESRNKTSKIYELGDTLVVSLSWESEPSRRTLTNETLIFRKGQEYVFVYARQKYLIHPNTTEGPSPPGIQPQICVFQGSLGHKGVTAADKTNVTKTTEEPCDSTVCPVTYQFLEANKKFPYAFTHNFETDVSLGLIVLNVWPPVYDIMAEGAWFNELQITFMSAAEGGGSEYWFFPQDFMWYTNFVVYLAYDDEAPYYDKIDKLSRQLYCDQWRYVDFTDKAFASAASTAWYSLDGPRVSVLNKVGMISVMPRGGGLVFWNGTIPRHLDPEGSYHFLAVYRDNYTISSDFGSKGGSRDYTSVYAEIPSRFGYHVEAWLREDFDCLENCQFNVSLYHCMESWSDSDKIKWTIRLTVNSPSNLTEAYFPIFNHGTALQLNDAAWEIYANEAWGSEPAVTLVFDAGNYKNITFEDDVFYINLVKNRAQILYPAGTEFNCTLLLWLHYGHISNVEQITPLHSIQPVKIAPFHEHFYRIPVAGLETFAFNTEHILVDARRVGNELTVDLLVFNNSNKIIQIYSDEGTPRKVTNCELTRTASPGLLLINISQTENISDLTRIVLEFGYAPSPLEFFTWVLIGIGAGGGLVYGMYRSRRRR